MNIIARMLARRRSAKATKRLAATLKPCPEIRERRLRQMSPQRRARAERNAAAIAEMIGGVR
jgi:hypothetical protein